MDPVSVFISLYDTKCLKFGSFDLKSGLVAPYYMNLRRLPLYPELMDAVVTQVVERYLTPHAMAMTLSQIRQNSTRRSVSNNQKAFKKESSAPESSSNFDSDSQLGEDESDSVSDDGDWENVVDESDRIDPIICGVPYGAVPLASAIAHRSKLPFLFDRKEPKAYGDQQALLDDFTDETRRMVKSKSDNEIARSIKRKQPVILIEDVICSGESVLETVRRLEKQQNIRVEFVICILDREENGINLLLQREGIQVISLYKISVVLRVLEATGRISSQQFMEVKNWIDRSQFSRIGINPTPVSQHLTEVAIESHKTSSPTIQVTSN